MYDMMYDVRCTMYDYDNDSLIPERCGGAANEARVALKPASQLASFPALSPPSLSIIGQICPASRQAGKRERCGYFRVRAPGSKTLLAGEEVSSRVLCQYGTSTCSTTAEYEYHHGRNTT